MTFSSAQLTFRHGSILDFSYEKDPQRSAIVNPANQACLGGGGLDAAVNKAGGPQLQQARRGLPVLQNPHGVTKIRCPKGEARVTGPGNYGSLRVPYVIHAVGADYNLTPNREQGDMILQGAYRSALEVAEGLELEAVAFPILSGGVYRGNCSVKDVMRLGLDTIRSYPLQYVKHVYVYAFGGNDFQLLQSLARDVSLTPTEISYSLPQVLPQVSEGMYPESSTYTHEPMSTSDAPYSNAPYNPSSTNSLPLAVASAVSGSSSTHLPVVQAYPSGVSAADTDPMTSYPQPSAPMALPDVASMYIMPPPVAEALPVLSHGGSETYENCGSQTYEN